MKRLIQGFDRYVNQCLKAIVIGLLAMMTVVVLTQVIFRAFHASIIWSEEISIYMMVWCTFLGAGLCCRKGAMIGLEALRTALPPCARKWVTLLSALVTAAFLLTLTAVGIRISIQMWTQTTPILKLPMGLIYSAIPAGSIIMAVNTLFSTWESWEELKT